MIEYIQKDSIYSLTLLGNLEGKSGKVKVVAKNVGGEVTSEADLVISGQPPSFIEPPIKCTILEGGRFFYIFVLL